MISTPLAADFGPGTEAAAVRRRRGAQLDGRVSFYASRRRLRRSLARRRRWRGAQLDREFAFYASRRRLRPRGGGGGAHQLDVEFAFYASRRRLRAWPRGGESAFHRLSKLPTASGLARRRQFPVLETTQTSQVLSRWNETTWPASLGWPGPSGPAAQLVLNWSASSRAQQVPHGQTTWSTALSWLDGPADITTRLSMFSCTAGITVSKLPIAKIQTLQKSRFSHLAKISHLAKPCKNPDFRTHETLQKSICKTLRNFAKLLVCKTTNCETLRNIAKHCETIFATIFAKVC